MSRDELLVAGSIDTAPMVLGPLLRRVTDTGATVWVQTERDAVVQVKGAGRSWSTRTFAVHGSHYALVLLDGLEPGQSFEYVVLVDDEQVWPVAGVELPPSTITTLNPDRPTRLTFGSCRTSEPHDADGNAHAGVDAMRAFALELTTREPGDYPDLIAFLGDQVYADDTTDAMREFIESRRSLDEDPGTELKDYVEYAHLYDLAWSEPFNRWLLSTVPSVMIFDDHDVRDDWNTSLEWRQEMESLPWWHDRIVGALASYWVYQHAGNLSQQELRDDEIYQLIEAHAASGSDTELDLTEALDEFAARVDQHPDDYRWSYTVELGDSRLIMVDSRAARDVTPGARKMLDAAEQQWLDEQMRGDVEHLFIGTSLPFLLIPGLHDMEAINEAMTNGAWGSKVANIGERLRQAFDLEHWAAFQQGFRHVFEQAVAVASGQRGAAPATVTFLSGDVHNSYVAEVPTDELPPGSGRIIQAVCSPIRNPMPMPMRMMMAHITTRVKKPLDRFIKRSKKMDPTPWDWVVTRGPWFDNNIATVDVEGPRLRLSWMAGEVVDDRTQEPRLRTVADVSIPSLESPATRLARSR